MTSLPLLDDSVQNTASASMAGEGFCSIDPIAILTVFGMIYVVCRLPGTNWSAPQFEAPFIHGRWAGDTIPIGP